MKDGDIDYMRLRDMAASAGLVVLTIIAILAVPGCALWALWTGEWRWLIPSVIGALYLWRLIK